jgi:hypothetical protein
MVAISHPFAGKGSVVEVKSEPLSCSMLHDELTVTPPECFKQANLIITAVNDIMHGAFTVEPRFSIIIE